MKKILTIHQVLNWIAQEKYEEAQNGLRPLIALSPCEDKLYSLYHYCTQRIAETPDGYLIRPVLRKARESWRVLLDKARDYANRGDYARGIELLKQAQEKLLAGIEALPAYPAQPSERKLRVVFQFQALLLLQQAKCFYLSGDKMAAKAVYKKCLQSRFQSSKLSPRDSVDILLRLKQPASAWKYLEQVAAQADREELLPLDELRVQIYLALGKPEQAQKAQRKACSYYKQKIQRFALDESLYEDFARFLTSAARYHEAINANAKAIALAPDSYNCYLKQAYLYAQVKDKFRAGEALQKAKQVGSPTQQRYSALERGKIYELLEDYKSAEAVYQKEEARPEARRDCLVALYRKTGQPEKIKEVEQALHQRTHFDERVSEQMLEELID